MKMWINVTLIIHTPFKISTFTSIVIAFSLPEFSLESASSSSGSSIILLRFQRLKANRGYWSPQIVNVHMSNTYYVRKDEV